MTPVAIALSVCGIWNSRERGHGWTPGILSEILQSRCCSSRLAPNRGGVKVGRRITFRSKIHPQPSAPLRETLSDRTGPFTSAHVGVYQATKAGLARHDHRLSNRPSVHKFCGREIVNAVLIVAFEKAAHTTSHSARTRPSVTRRHRLALQTIENRVRPSERIGQFMN